MSSECIVKNNTDSCCTLMHSCNGSPRMETGREHCSVDKEDVTFLSNEYNITKTQHIKIGMSNSCDVSKDNLLNEHFLNKKSIKNGLVKKTSKRRKNSNGPVRDRPRKALVAMYHSQISGDKNAIKIRIKKSSFLSQVSFPFVNLFSQI